MPEQSDVVVIGAGIAGALVAWRLALKGIKVLMLEAGPRVDRSAATQRFQYSAMKTLEAPYEPTKHAPAPSSVQPDGYYIQTGSALFRSTYQRQVGGTTWHWLGTALRHLPNDFRLASTYGVGVDWPIGYDELEVWYGAAEHALGVAGDSGIDLGSPRSRDYPMPPIPMTYLDGQVAAAAKGLGLDVRPTPQARNSQDFDGRPSCCGNSSCVPICPVGAKYDATVHVAKAEQAGAKLIDNAVVVRLDLVDNRRIRAAVFRRSDATEEDHAIGKIFVLAAHAIESPKLLLISGSAAYPDGLANSSGQVGRNLMDHPAQLSWALSAKPVWPYRGPLETSGIENYRDGDFRREHAAFRIPIGNDGWTWPGIAPPRLAEHLIEQGIGDNLNRRIRDHVSRQLRLVSLVEQLPDVQNRIVPHFDHRDSFGVPRPRIEYRIDDYTRRGMAEARMVHERVFAAMGATAIQHGEGHEGAGHIMGTLRMGLDEKTSVVDADLRAHDHPNLFVVGSAVFPSGATANPSLTIAALSLRCAQTIERTL